MLEAEIREEWGWRREPRGIFLPSLSAAVLFGYFTPRMCICITWVIRHIFSYIKAGEVFFKKKKKEVQSYLRMGSVGSRVIKKIVLQVHYG